MKQLALFRGINVGSAKRISMEQLASVFVDLGFSDVKTVLNSGNVIFSSRSKKVVAPELIEQKLDEKFDLQSKTLVVSNSILESIVAAFPFSQTEVPASNLLVAFFANKTDLVKLKPLLKQDWGADGLVVGKHAAYLSCANGILASELVKQVGKLAGDSVTTRNWATVSRLVELVSV